MGGGAAGGGGGVPAGAAVMTDALASARAVLTAPDTKPALADAWSAFVQATYTDTRLTPTELAALRVGGLLDLRAAPTDARQSMVFGWASSQTTSGTAPTNPGNALGQRDGAVATVKTGGLAAGQSALTLGGFPHFQPGTTPELLLWFQFSPGVADSVTIVSDDSPTPIRNGSTAAENFLTSPLVVPLSSKPDSTFQVRFQHNATTPATGGSVTVDAVAVRTQGVL